ncbi:hypothetical protein E0K89_002080 [Aquicoccus sp. SCR17]|nr:hypothetical protein [Carideicomes alvinocaridis]
MHFYVTTRAERLAVDPADMLFMEKPAKRSSVELMPPNFVPPAEFDPISAKGSTGSS